MEQENNSLLQSVKSIQVYLEDSVEPGTPVDFYGRRGPSGVDGGPSSVVYLGGPRKWGDGKGDQWARAVREFVRTHVTLPVWWWGWVDLGTRRSTESCATCSSPVSVVGARVRASQHEPLDVLRVWGRHGSRVHVQVACSRECLDAWTAEKTLAGEDVQVRKFLTYYRHKAHPPQSGQGSVCLQFLRPEDLGL